MVICPADQTVHTDLGQAYATLFYTDPLVTDNADEPPVITCDVESGSQIGIGESEVICQAVDLTGNRGSCSFTVLVTGRYRLLINIVHLSFCNMHLC